MGEYARLTEGYSGADLQALVYNAHLDAVHSSITESESAQALDTPSSDPSSTTPTFTSFGGPPSDTVASRAEETARNKRVSLLPVMHPRCINSVWFWQDGNHHGLLRQEPFREGALWPCTEIQG